MGVVTARLLFLAFLALTATITYNALYLQAHPPHGMADATLMTPVGHAKTRVIGVELPGADASTSTRVESAYEKTQASGAVAIDLPAQMPSGGESQLVVRAIQRELSLLGYDVGGVDGQLSDKTRQAISAFQMREGLAVTGLPSDDVLRQILLGDTISTSDVTGSIPAADSIAAHVGENGTVLGVQ
jgi:peptidoglycan hydrolase-like protein with peptidoglycan-binding domain